MASKARFLAISIVSFYLVEGAIRLALLVPVYHYGRGSVPVHGTAVVLFTFGAGFVLTRLRGRPSAQLLVSVFLAVCWIVLLLFDAVAFITAPRLHTAMPLTVIAEFYCAGSLTGCLRAQPGMVTLIAALIATLTLLIWIAADEIAELAGSLNRRVAATLGTWMGSLRWVLILTIILYGTFWISFPRQAAAREPLVDFLKPQEFIAGPIELITRPRPVFSILPTPDVRPRTLVLITVDSLRADAVELRPGKRSLTPFLQRLATTGKLHDLGPASAVCANSYCGIIALQSGSDWAALQNGPPVTLPDVLAANGYRSHFLLSGPHRVDKNLGELYGPNLTTFLDDASSDSAGLGDDREQIRRLRSLDIRDPARTYLYIHLMSAHSAGLRFDSATDKATIWQALFGGGSPRDYASFYRRGVRQADWAVGQIFSLLREKHLLRDALVIITSDHGERISSGRRGHGVPLDPDVAAIPLLVFDTRDFVWPRQARASQMDVAPTLITAAGIQPPVSWPGEPLQRSMRRIAAPLDTLHASALIGDVAGQRVLVRCKTSTGRTDVMSMSGEPISPRIRDVALASASALQRGLIKRADATRCFR